MEYFGGQPTSADLSDFVINFKQHTDGKRCRFMFFKIHTFFSTKMPPCFNMIIKISNKSLKVWWNCVLSIISSSLNCFFLFNTRRKAIVFLLNYMSNFGKSKPFLITCPEGSRFDSVLTLTTRIWQLWPYWCF